MVVLGVETVRFGGVDQGDQRIGGLRAPGGCELASLLEDGNDFGRSELGPSDPQSGRALELGDALANRVRGRSCTRRARHHQDRSGEGDDEPETSASIYQCRTRPTSTWTKSFSS